LISACCDDGGSARKLAMTALLDTTRQLMTEIRKVDGLVRVEVNVQKGDPSEHVLYYHWRSAADEDAYRKTELFKRAIAGVTPYLADRRIIVTTNAD